jgi:hypothetical protein
MAFSDYGLHFLNTTDVATTVHCDAWPAHYERDVAPSGGTGTPVMPPAIISKRVWVVGYYSASTGQMLAERGGISVENGNQLCTLSFAGGEHNIEFSDL